MRKRGHLNRLLIVGVAAPTAAALLAGCGGGSNSSAPTSTSAPTTASAPASTTQSSTPATTSTVSSPSGMPPGGTTTPSGSSSPPTSSANPSRCRSSDLAATDDGGQGAGGTYFGVIVFRNTTQQACTLDGFPGLLRLDPAGHPRPTSVTRRGVAHLVTLAPQGRASFGYSAADGPHGTATSCPSPARLEVTPPNAFNSIVVAEKMPDCGPDVPVSAVLPGVINDVAQALS